MRASVCRSEAGRIIVEAAYRAHPDSDLARCMVRRTVATPLGETFVLERSEPGKPPLILLHGSVSNSASWLGVVPLFSRRFSVYCLDIPGEPGLSAQERLPLASDAPGCWLGGTLDALGIRKAFMLGMSLGGWYALDFAVRNPERISALSLISAGGIAPQRRGFLFKALLFLMLGAYGRERLNRTIYYKVEMTREILEYQALVSKHFRPVTEPLPLFTDEQLRRLPMPLQYFGGDHDTLLDTGRSVARLKAILPGAEAWLLEDTGHAIVDKFDTVEEFLSRHR